MSYIEKDLFVILWGLKGQLYFMAENSDLAKLFMRNFIKNRKEDTVYTLYKVDKKTWFENRKEKSYYVDSVTSFKGNITDLKSKIDRACKEQKNKRQLEILFEGEEINAK